MSRSPAPADRPLTPEAFFEGHPFGLAVHRAVCAMLAHAGPYEVRTSTAQVAFWRRHGFAYLWLPDRYLRHAAAEVVLSIALGRLDASPRFKDVAHPSARHWIHHLELGTLADLDAEVEAWLVEAADRAT